MQPNDCPKAIGQQYRHSKKLSRNDVPLAKWLPRMLDNASKRDGTLQWNGALNGMVASVSKLLKKVDDLRAAALAARALAEHFAGDERQSILQLAESWDAQAKDEEDRIIQFSVEAEAR